MNAGLSASTCIAYCSETCFAFFLLPLFSLQLGSNARDDATPDRSIEAKIQLKILMQTFRFTSGAIVNAKSSRYAGS